MSNHCEDCGCILEKGICSNCHEELFILTYQAEYIDQPLSNEFVEKAKEQEGDVSRRQMRGQIYKGYN